jgi:hypothetical protein
MCVTYFCRRDASTSHEPSTAAIATQVFGTLGSSSTDRAPIAKLFPE